MLSMSPCRCFRSKLHQRNSWTNIARSMCKKNHCNSCIGFSRRTHRTGNRCPDRYRTRWIRRRRRDRRLFSRRYTPCICCRISGRNRIRRCTFPLGIGPLLYRPLLLASVRQPTPRRAILEGLLVRPLPQRHRYLSGRQIPRFRHLHRNLLPNRSRFPNYIPPPKSTQSRTITTG
jgi:hypothetical protein